MDATIERFDRLIRVALEHLEHVKGTVHERYAEELLESLVCQRERYTHFLSLMN